MVRKWVTNNSNYLNNKGSINIEHEASLSAALTGTLIFLSNSGVFLISLISFLDFKGSSNFAGHIMFAMGVTVITRGDKYKILRKDNISANISIFNLLWNIS